MISKPIKVAFTPDYIAQGWTGGLNYLTNLLRAILSNPDSSIEPVLFVGKKTDKNLIPNMEGLKVIEASILDLYHPFWFCRHGLRKMFSRDILLRKLLENNGISILSHSIWLGKGEKIKSLCWIPDFQHIHYPEFFDNSEVESRNRDIKEIIDSGSHIILSSREAQKDLGKINSSYLDKSSVLRFVANIDFNSIPERNSLETRYDFTGDYIYVPAQFWEHKNHSIIIEALDEVKKRGEQIKVICTGNKDDYRNPDYFSQLMNKVEINNLLNEFIVLGLVPYRDVIGLMYHSKAVINPSLFEGWSTVVEECKLLKKHILLSDIPVHQEQDPEYGKYFPADNYQKLASLMIESISDDEEIFSTKQLDNNLKDMKLVYAKCYEEIIHRQLN